MPKIVVECKSLLLQRSLELLLRDWLSPKATFIVSDHAMESEKPVLIVGKHIPKPFTKAELFLVIEKLQKLEEIKSISLDLSGNDRVQRFTDRYIKAMIEIV